MERVRFEYEVFTVVRLTREEVTRLSECCDHHYDATVKSLSTPGRGAILNGARNEIGTDDHVDVRASYQQLDLLAKATEMILVGDAMNLPLHMKLRELLIEAGAEWKRQNPR